MSMLHFVVSLLSFTVFAAPLETKNVVSGRDSATYAILAGKGMAKILLTAATGSKEAALTILVLEDGAQLTEHVHENSAELLYIEDGAIEMVIDGKAVKAVKGDAVYIPKGARHSARPTAGVGPVRAVQIYVGPGPEQRFITNAKALK